MEQPKDALNPKSFRLYTGTAPLQVQIVGGLMWLGGIGLVLQGIPLLLLFGIGIVPICLGILTVHYARLILKLQRSGYRGALAILVLTLAAYLAAFFTSAVTTASITVLSGAVCYILIAFAILYSNRARFV